MRSRALLESVSDLLERSEVNLFQVSRETDLGYQTILNIKNRRANPTIETLAKIEEFLWSPHPTAKTCETCISCLEYDHKNKVYGCEMAMAGGDEELTPCQMYKEFKK